MQVLPEDIYDEISSLCEEYKPLGRQTFRSVQAYVRLLVLDHLRRLRGRTPLEENLFAMLDPSRIELQPCPNCCFATNMDGTPTLRKSAGVVKCQVCGSAFDSEEVTIRIDR